MVVPTHNRSEQLRLALRGALGQEGVDVEVAVVDDGSADGTPELLAELAAGDPRLRVFRHETPQGVARARNRGIAEARGEWIAFLDDDDVWGPLKLRCQLDAARRRGADLVYGTYVSLDGRRRPVRVVRAPDPETLRQRLLRTNPVGGPSTFMARAERVRAVGGFDERFAALADWDLLLRLAEGGTAARCDEVVVGYVEHGQNMMATKGEQIERELAALAEKHASAARAAGVRFGDEWLADWRAMGLRKSGRRLPSALAYARRAAATRSAADLAKAAAVLVGDAAFQRGRRALGRLDAAPAWLDDYAA